MLYRLSKLTLFFCFGCVSLLAQVLLFRDYLTATSGNELTIGFFFFSWLTWVSVGALVAKLPWLTNSKLVSFYPLLQLIYIPACLLQQYLLLNLPGLIGQPIYEAFPIATAAPILVLVNAPVSLATGLLFVIGCKWIEEDLIPAGRVYVTEALGSFAGAATVTICLAHGTSHATIWTVTALLLCSAISLASYYINRKAKSAGRLVSPIAAGILAGVLLCLILAGVPAKWENKVAKRLWNRSLPAGQLQGHFSTSQARYLYGTYEGEFVVTNCRSVTELIPNREATLYHAASVMSQNPDASRILIIGSGNYALSRFLCNLQQTTRVVWLHTDLEYPRKLKEVLPAEIAPETAGKVETPEEEPRAFLQRDDSKFDLILIEVDDYASLSCNRFLSAEFFAIVRNALGKRGVAAISFPAGENAMQPEQVYLGASLLVTLSEIFDNFALEPGEKSRLFACQSATILSENGPLLDRRIHQVKGFEQLPPEYLSSAFDIARIQQQRSRYLELLMGQDSSFLVSSDTGPKAYLYSLLLAIKQMDWLHMDISYLERLSHFLLPAWVLLLLVIGFGRVTYLMRSRGEWRFQLQPYLRPGDLLLMVFITSLTGMILNLTLMFSFQSVFGSLYLYFGIICSLFMLGIFIAGSGMQRWLQHQNIQWYSVPVACLLFLTVVAMWTMFPQLNSQTTFAILFIATGMVCGGFLPIAAYQLKIRGWQDKDTGSGLELLDHAGGAIGSILTGLLFLPLIGITGIQLVISLSICLVLVSAMVNGEKDVEFSLGTASWSSRLVRTGAYIFTGTAVYILLVSQLWSVVGATLAGERELERGNDTPDRHQNLKLRFPEAPALAEDFLPAESTEATSKEQEKAPEQNNESEQDDFEQMPEPATATTEKQPSTVATAAATSAVTPMPTKTEQPTPATSPRNEELKRLIGAGKLSGQRAKYYRKAETP